MRGGLPRILLAFAAGLLLSASVASAAPERWKTRAHEIYARIIAMPTVKGRGQVPVMANYLAEQFKAGGFAAEDIQVLPFEDTAALVVRYRANGSTDRKPIMFLAHMDVVEALASDWTREPFKLTEKDGYFYGRGSLDMKSGVAQLVTTFLRLRSEGFKPNRDLILALTGDEETTTGTARALATQWRPLVDAEYALNADNGGGWFSQDDKPLGYRMDASEKVSVVYALTARNRGGHAALPRADNAIYALATALDKVAAHQFPPQADEITRGYFRAAAPLRKAELADAMRRFAEDPSDRAAAEVLAREPIENAMMRTTCVATRLAGGHADNALPQTATATVNCRLFPGTSVESVRETLRRVVGPDIEVAAVGEARPAPPSPLRKDVLDAFAKAVHARFPGMPIIPSMGLGYSDGRELRAAGIPTYGVGGNWLRMPDDARAHGSDERLPVAAFYGGLDHWYVMAKTLAGE